MDDLNIPEMDNESLGTSTKLSPEDNNFLNCVSSLDELDENERELPPLERRARCNEIMQERIATMRLKYAGNPLALEYIDNYDPKSEYRRLTSECLKAEKDGDIELADQIQKQIDEKYPLLCAERKNEIL